MKKRKFHIRLFLLLVLLVSLTGFAVGKYIRTLPSHSSQVTFTAKLADSFVLRESKAEKQSDGTYKLSDTEYIINATQNYVLIPGVDVPKDPHVVITGKTSEIPAYLYVEVVSNVKDQLQFSLENHWTQTIAKHAQHGGTVYVYCTTDTKAPVKITGDQTVYIFKDNKIYVSQHLLGTQTNELITIYAYLEEVR